MGITVASRLLGFMREATIVALIGVHDFTDSYFALAAVVMWIQNWSFGAHTLWFIPSYLSVSAENRGPWFGALLRRNAVVGGVAALLFLAGFSQLESWMLAGRNALGGGAALLLSLTIPSTLLGGLLHSRSVALGNTGIFDAARAQLASNLVGFCGLLICVVAGSERIALPFTLFLTQLSLVVVLATKRRPPHSEDAHGIARVVRGSQLAASTAENLGFNLNAIAQQAVAGRLPAGAVTINAYATRIVMSPLLGILQPLQQHLLVRFAQADQHAEKLLMRVVLFGIVAGIVGGALLFTAVHLTAQAWSSSWRQSLTDFHIDFLLLGYALYAGIVFSNQAIARFLFANGAGWRYALTMLIAYGAGTGLKVWLSPQIGILALVGSAILAETVAVITLLSSMRGGSFPRAQARTISLLMPQ